MIEIIQGEKQIFNINLKSKKTGLPLDLTGNTEIEVCFKSGDIIISKKKTDSKVSVVGDVKLGQITTTLLIADTPLLPPTSEGAIEVVVTKGAGEVEKSQDLNAFSVVAGICP